MKTWNSTLERHAPLRATKGLRSKKPIRPVNPQRKARLYARNFGDYSELVRQMPCCVCGRYGVQAAHAKARGMGGCNSDKSSLLPMCERCHRLQHVMGTPAFEARFEIDLEAEAALLWEEYGF